MSIFEFAINMERDGEKYYRELAANTNYLGLKIIFTTIADEEVEHLRLFENLRNQTPLDIAHSSILEVSKNIFAEMKEAGNIAMTENSDQKNGYETALDMEKKAYTFYEEKAEETGDEAVKHLLKALAREERRHHRILEGVLDFISRPQQWLEDAEFVHLSEY